MAPWLLPVAVVIALLGLARAFDTFPGDRWALAQLVALRSEWLTEAAIIVSAVGQGGIGLGLALPWIPAALVAVMLVLRRWGDALFLAAAVAAPALNLALKELAARERPDPVLALVGESGYGFPSGHAVFAAAFLGAVAMLLEREPALAGRTGVRRGCQFASLVLMLAIGFTRVYLGVHWPSDVIAGFLCGALYLVTAAAVRRWFAGRHRGDHAGGA